MSSLSAKKKRKRIVVLFNFRRGWMGGIIYIINLVNSLNALDDDEKPELIILYNKDLEDFIKEINYPYAEASQWDFPGFVKGYLSSFVAQKNLFIEKIVEAYKPDGIYPLNDWPVSGKQYLKRGTRIVAWIPDLQHKFYPHFFGKIRVFFRELRINLLLSNAQDMAVSSDDVKNHFNKFYSLKSDFRIHSLKFVSVSSTEVPFADQKLRDKYKVPQEYLMISNQFTNHKNHLLVFKALSILKRDNVNCHIVFTGNMNFKGNEAYMSAIRTFIKNEGLESMISLLGVIPRMEQLSLMKNARAIVQPSLFEGWSTVIEDAKTLGVPVIASDLSVNIEQLRDLGTYFNRFDEKALASVIANFNPARVEYESYEARVRTFAECFMNIFRS